MATPPPTTHPDPSSTDEPPNPTIPETPVDLSPALKAPCPCPTCTLTAESGLDIWVTPGGGSSNSPQKAHYVPPRPDADTFADQQAFLDSLASISIDSVGDDSKKCPTCWKPYGEEADPGYDNSEQPVRLKCKHVFGDKCLRDTFGLPTTSTITLEPLAFGPGSRGRQLGQRLHAYWEKSKDQEHDEYASAFTQMANVRPESTTERFGMYSHLLACLSLGPHWGSVIQELRRRVDEAPRIHDIILLESGIIMDRRRLDDRRLESSMDAYALFQGMGEFTGQTFPVGDPNVSTTSNLESLPKLHDAFSDVNKGRDERLRELLKAERAMQERNKRQMNRSLGIELGRIYSEYLKQRATTEEPEEAETSLQQYFVNARIRIHKKNTKQSSFRIESLDRYVAQILQGLEDDDSDAEDEKSNTQNDVLLRSLFPVITRKMCEGCCTEDSTVPSSVPVPTSLWWKDLRKIPDDCPICHKVLFHKGNSSSLFRFADCEISGPEDPAGTIGDKK